MLRVSDFLSQAGLLDETVVALVLFFIAFLALAARALKPSRKREMDEMARLPLDDAEPKHERPGAHE